MRLWEAYYSVHAAWREDWTADDEFYRAARALKLLRAGVPVTMVASSSTAELPILVLDGGMQSSLLRNSHLLHARIACRHYFRARAQQGLGVRPPLMVRALACVRRPATGL
eukprot:855649-Pleurochrysis_carterae.AAC.1